MYLNYNVPSDLSCLGLVVVRPADRVWLILRRQSLYLLRLKRF